MIKTVPIPASRSARSLHDRRGFALLITITLLAFLVLLLVSLASLTRVETQVASNNQQLSQARQNALFGLNVALGQLQKYAGPDQRVTARSDFSGGAPVNPFYTGVWSTTAAGALVPATPDVWLVSGNEDPAAPLTITPATAHAATDSVLLVGEKTAGPDATRHVRARRKILESANVPGFTTTQPVGSYAYWIGDEGVKARANLAADTSTDLRASYAFASAQRSAVEVVERPTAPATGTVGTPWGDALYPSGNTPASALALGQLPLLSTAGGSIAKDALAARYHDLTAVSASVLANTRDGGLRQDLSRILTSNVGPASGDFLFSSVGTLGADLQSRPPTWGTLRAWMQNGVAPGNTLAPKLPNTDATGSSPVSPVLLWAENGFAIVNAGGTLRTQYFPRVILWNPHSVPLAGGIYEVGISSINSNPNTALRVESTSGQFVRLFTLFSHSYATSVYSGSLMWLRVRVNVPQLAPGQARVFSVNTFGTTTYSAGNTQLEPGDNGGYVFFSGTYTIPGTIPGPYRIVAFSGSTANTSASVQSPGGEHYAYMGATRASAPPIVNTSIAASDAPINSYQYIHRMGIGGSLAFDSSVGESSIYPLPDGSVPEPQVRMVIHARMGNADSGILPQRWIANANPRAYFQGRAEEGSNPTYLSAFATASVRQIDSDPNGDVSVGSNFTLGAGVALRLTLFDPAPADPGLVQSIAQLQHAPLANSGFHPAYSIGNSLQSFRIQRTDTSRTFTGANLRAVYDVSRLANASLWDTYFFSTVPSGLTAAELTTAGYALPNPLLHPLTRDPADLLNYQRASARLLLQGGFNVNSTSEQAWRALLSALNRLPYDPTTGTISATLLQNPFSRFERPPSGSTNPWSGYRQLTDAQIARLAANLVSEIRLRGPFKSLSDFVNRSLVNDATGLKGALQAAIDASDLGATATQRLNDLDPYNANATPNSATLAGVQDIAAFRGVATGNSVLPVSSRNAFGPGYLSQADILSRIGARLTARSDTFVIRVAGEALNPLESTVAAPVVISRAYLEAVVQRLPDYVEPSLSAELTPVAGTDNERFGRRFQIVSFRWITPEDI